MGAETHARFTLIMGALFGLTAVALGTAGAHLLADLPDGAQQTFATGVRYQMWHALALLVIGVLQALYPGNVRFRWSARLMATGIILFSGALYALVLVQWSGFSWAAPAGGMCLLAAWLVLLWALLGRGLSGGQA